MKFFYYRGTAPTEQYDNVYIGQAEREGLDETLRLTKPGGTWYFRSQAKFESILAYTMAKDSFRIAKQHKQIKFVVDESFDISPPKPKKPKKKRETKASPRKRVDEHAPEDTGRGDLDDLV